jgi:N-acetyltransferase
MSIASADSTGLSSDTTLVSVDATAGLYCHPQLLPTPLGIPRLFVPSSHRRQGIATHLLTAAAATFVHGCPLDPARGEVAFTQPTGAGRAVMNEWGKGGVRVYDERE